MRIHRCTSLGGLGPILLIAASLSQAAELATLKPANWDEFVPKGKEADAIYGDFVLRNDHILAVVAKPVATRNANMTIRQVGGCLIDLTLRDQPNDQLGAFYPGGPAAAAYSYGGVTVGGAGRAVSTAIDAAIDAEAQGESVSLRMLAGEGTEGLSTVVTYTLADGDPFVTVRTTYTNRGDAEAGLELVDSLRADRSFEKAANGTHGLFWVYDEAFGQAYGIAGEGLQILTASDARNSTLRYQTDGKTRITLAPGEHFTLERKIFPGRDLLQVRDIAARWMPTESRNPVRVKLADRSGAPVSNARVELLEGETRIGWGRTNEAGELAFGAGPGRYTIRVSTLGQGGRERELLADGPLDLAIDDFPEPGRVVAAITDDEGRPIPCKVQFVGLDGTIDPDFGPDSGEHAIRNLYYSHDGAFRQILAPGTYQAIVSHGPEYDAVFTNLIIRPGEETPLQATLKRSVETQGWISTDFHSHSSPSGDNTSSQYGRVLNLLCEHIEFAPCTEHNRISTYTPHLEALGAVARMATCTGIELTGSPLPLNHQNAFPLTINPRTQDNGAPLTDQDPEVQIERLALWDNGGDKLVQVNHPDLGWMFYDRDGDGSPDGGHPKMAGIMDVVEVHPPQSILEAATFEQQGNLYNNTIVNWLQLLNQGHRIPGVVNTDAHYNFHGSGWLRNWVKSPTDDPAQIATLEVVHAAEQGNVIMSTGPFLDVTASSGTSEAIPGQDLDARNGSVTLQIRVQCPNWFDINRVQILLNGRQESSLNLTRAANPDDFGDGPVKFEKTVQVPLEADTHIIVVAIGEGLTLGPVMGPEAGATPPVAVANPVFADVDGGGFTPNRDTLGAPLPVKGGRPVPTVSESEGARTD